MYLLNRIPHPHVPFTCPSTTVPQQTCWSSPSPTTHTSSILRRRTTPPPPSHCPNPPHLPLSPSQYRAPGTQAPDTQSSPASGLAQDQIRSKCRIRSGPSPEPVQVQVLNQPGSWSDCSITLVLHQHRTKSSISRRRSHTAISSSLNSLFTSVRSISSSLHQSSHLPVQF